VAPDGGAAGGVTCVQVMWFDVTVASVPLLELTVQPPHATAIAAPATAEIQFPE